MLNCQVRGPRFKPRQKFGSRFLLHAHPFSASWTTSHCIPESVSSLELASCEEERVEQKGADTLVVKKNHERNPMTQELKRNPESTKTWKRREGKALNTNGLCAQ